MFEIPTPRNSQRFPLGALLVAILGALPVLSGCGLIEPRSPDVRTDRLAYEIGDDAIVILGNRTRGLVSFDFCTVDIERRNGELWAPAGVVERCGGEDPRPTLVPGRRAMLSLPVGMPATGSGRSSIADSPMEEGNEYRVLVEVETTAGDPRTRERIASNAFAVEPRAGRAPGEGK